MLLSLCAPQKCVPSQVCGLVQSPKIFVQFMVSSAGLCCHQVHKNYGLLSSPVPHLLLRKIWQSIFREAKVHWEKWYHLLA